MSFGDDDYFTDDLLAAVDALVDAHQKNKQARCAGRHLPQPVCVA